MENSLIIILTTAILSALVSYFISTKTCRKKVDSYKNINVAIKESKKIIAEKETYLEKLDKDYEAQTIKNSERLSEINELAKKEQERVNREIEELKYNRQEFNNEVEDLRKKIENHELLLSKKNSELEEVKNRTKELVYLETNFDDIERKLKEKENIETQLTEEISQLKQQLEILKSDIDLYTRVDDFINYGVFETPRYLYETPERYQVEIKRIREKQKMLIRNNDAVNVVEEITVNGSTKTAKSILSGQVRLMLKAFNIECDLLFDKLNPANFSRTLERIEKIAEAMEKNTLSISNGISLEYFDLKHQECKLVYEFKLRKSQQDEEQRIIREQIREEQRAQREYTNAIKEAEKEELLYRKLLEKAKKQLADSHEEEKSGLEADIRILEMQLQEAVQKEERAKSLAEQTRRGHVYIISNIGSFGDGIYKIGLTRRLDPLDRVKELGDASVPFLFDVHAIIYSEDAPAMETALHRRFNHMRVNAVNRRKEFFRVSLEEIQTAVTEIYGFEAEFKMTVLAKDYYETLRLQGNLKEQQAYLPKNA